MSLLTSAPPPAPTSSRTTALSPAEASAAWNAGAVLVDLRSEDERRHGGELAGALTELPKGSDDTLLLVCADGEQSAALAASLPAGSAVAVTGGHDGWRDAVWRRWGELLIAEPQTSPVRFFRLLA